jgi:hypothetical protein
MLILKLFIFYIQKSYFVSYFGLGQLINSKKMEWIVAFDHSEYPSSLLKEYLCNGARFGAFSSLTRSVLWPKKNGGGI